MKFTTIIEEDNYRFVAEFENVDDPIIVANDDHLELPMVHHVIGSCQRSNIKSLMTDTVCSEVDSAYQEFLKKVYTLNGMKYTKKKVNYKPVSFQEMQANLRNKINKFQSDNGFSDKKMSKLLNKK